MQPEFALAIEHLTAKRFDHARLLFRELHTKHPDDAQVNYHYARLHDRMGEEAAAAPLYERAIALGLPDEDLREAFLCLAVLTAASVSIKRRSTPCAPDWRASQI
jgi:predicted Zn-dependent protease